jgi:hypothetical protein
MISYAPPRSGEIIRKIAMNGSIKSLFPERKSPCPKTLAGKGPELAAATSISMWRPAQNGERARPRNSSDAARPRRQGLSVDAVAAVHEVRHDEHGRRDDWVNSTDFRPKFPRGHDAFSPAGPIICAKCPSLIGTGIDDDLVVGVSARRSCRPLALVWRHLWTHRSYT